MASKINIFIPQPCHENWQEMTAVDKGKFCNSCQKKVIDFTRASDREILNAFKQNDHLCGRFLDAQLNRDLIQPREKSSLWLASTSAFISFIGLGTYEVLAQETIKTEQTDKKVLTDSVTSRSDEEIEVSGIVKDDVGPLPGVNVIIKGTRIGTQSDFNGLFKIQAKVNDILVFQYVGMDTKEIKVTHNKLSLEMKMDSSFMGEIIIKKKRTFLGRLFHKSKYK